MAEKVHKIVAISGSLRKDSCNSGLLRACIKAQNPRLLIEILDIQAFPLFNQQTEKESVPIPVKQVVNKVRGADAVLFANPEDNGLMTAAAKNAYDWLSRGGLNACVYKKQIAQIGAGVSGASMAAIHFKQVVNYCKVDLMDEPKVQVKKLEPGNFDQNGDLINKEVQKQICKFLESLVIFIDNKA